MVTQRTPQRDDPVQDALELRHEIEELSERCRRLYEEANDIVERLRQLRAAPGLGTPGSAEAGSSDA